MHDRLPARDTGKTSHCVSLLVSTPCMHISSESTGWLAGWLADRFAEAPTDPPLHASGSLLCGHRWASPVR